MTQKSSGESGSLENSGVLERHGTGKNFRTCPEIGRNRSGLRLGYTTGSCAAAAAKAAAQMLLSGEDAEHVRLMTPKGIELYLDVEQITRTAEYTECAVRKYSGDDPDVTDGLVVFARVEMAGCAAQDKRADVCITEERDFPEDGAFIEDGVFIGGGAGVGRVTKPGLEQKIGQAAINKVPRRMIREAVNEMREKYGCCETLRVTISIPDGEEAAKKTFNPRLGIEGGLSILGTSGIVEPMSEKALTDTIYLEMKMLRDSGCRYCYVVPGNYGTDFLKETLQAEPKLAVKCSNYVGETIDDAKLLGMKGILLIGHVGKFIKLAAGVMNTHSRVADCRMEVFAAHAAMAGAVQETARRLMQCMNTTEAIEIIREQGLLGRVMETVTERIEFYLRQRAGEELRIGLILFSPEDGILCRTKDADFLLEQIRREKGSTEDGQKRKAVRSSTQPEV